MLSSDLETVGTVENTVLNALRQTVVIAHQEVTAENPDLRLVGQHLRLGNRLHSVLESYRRDEARMGEPSPERPAPTAIEVQDDPSLTEITARLRGAWLIRKNALINYSENSGWSYNIPKTSFIKVVDTIKSFAPRGEFAFDDMVTTSGVKESHVYRVYILLYRAGLMRQQKSNGYFMNDEEAKRLDPEVIWKYIPKE